MSEQIKQFRVKCDFIVEGESAEEAYERLIDYLAECAQYKETAFFEFEEVQP